MRRRPKAEIDRSAGAQDWRSLQQSGRKPRGGGGGSHSLPRRLFRFWRSLVILLVIAGLAGIGYLGWELVRDERRLAEASKALPIRAILFDTDGVLDETWVSRTLGLRAGMTLMETDIFDLRDRLEAEGQVRRARVERLFPDQLRIRVEEHVPLFRIALDEGGERPTVYLVSREGTLYRGVRYQRATFAALPWVVPYRHADGAIEPFNGIERVAELLDLVKVRNPALYRSWQVVSLQHYTGLLDFPGEIIEVRSPRIPRLIFAANLDFGQQLDRLDLISEVIRERGNPSLEQVDLSLHQAAAVRFSSPEWRNLR